MESEEPIVFSYAELRFWEMCGKLLKGPTTVKLHHFGHMDIVKNEDGTEELVFHEQNEMTEPNRECLRRVFEYCKKAEYWHNEIQKFLRKHGRI